MISLRSIVHRQTLLTGVAPLVLVAVASIVLVVRNALVESRETAATLAAQNAATLDQATRLLESHWRTLLAGSRAGSGFTLSLAMVRWEYANRRSAHFS